MSLTTDAEAARDRNGMCGGPAKKRRAAWCRQAGHLGAAASVTIALAATAAGLVAPAASAGDESVDLKPLGLTDDDLLVGGPDDRCAALQINVPLLRRIVLAPDDVHGATLNLICRPVTPHLAVLVRDVGLDRDATNLADVAALRSIPLRAGEELALVAWKPSWHYNGGVVWSAPAVLRIDADGTRRRVVLPPAPAWQDAEARTELGVFALAGLANRDRFAAEPARRLLDVTGRAPATAGDRPGTWRVADARGLSLVLNADGSLHLHTNGRAKFGREFDWAPTLLFTPDSDGIYAIEGRLNFLCAQADQPVAWMAGRLVKAGAPLRNSTVALHRLLRPPAATTPVAGSDFDPEPLARFTVRRSSGETVTVTNGIAEALRHWLDGSWANHGLLLVPERDGGGPFELLVARNICGSAMVRSHPKHLLFDHAVKPQADVYATVRDGHLYYGDRRLRLWGMVKDAPGARVRQLGFNCLRTWFQDSFYDAASAKAGAAMTYVPGDGSALDRFDRLMADMKQNDVFVMFATMIGLGMPVKTGLQESGWLRARHGTAADWSEWTNAVLSAGSACHTLSYVDDRLWEVRLRHAANVLNHVNPYTGKRYAEEEIIALIEINNEAGHVKNWLDRGFDGWPDYFRRLLRARWCAWAKAKYGGEAALRAAWGRLEAGEGLDAGTLQLEPLALNRGKYSLARQMDFQTFLIELVADRNRDYMAFCRRQAPEGVGVNVVPFSCDSQYRPSIPWLYQNSLGDSATVSMYFWRNDSMLASPPGLYVLDSHRLENKLGTIYETGRGRPSRHRAEYPYMLGVLTDWQDFDIAVWHGAWIGDRPNEQLLAGTADPPAATHFWTAVHLEHDPVMSAAVALGGRLFLNGVIGVATDPAIYTVGRECIFGLGAWNGIGGPDMSRRVFTRGARIRLEPDGTNAGVLVDGRVPSPLPLAETPVQTGRHVTWDWPRARLIIDAPDAKVYVGPTCDQWTFEDGITLSGFNTPWIAFALVSRDGQPLATATTQAWVSAVFDARNTEFEYDYACAGGSVEQAKAVRNRGRAPVVVDPVAYTLSFPRTATMRYRSYDFAMRLAAESDIVMDNTWRQPPQTDWMGVLELGPRGTAAAVVADPSPGARQTPGPAGAGHAASELTDPRFAMFWHPVPGLSWGDSYHRAHRSIREAAFLMGRVDTEDFRDANRKTITFSDAVFLLDMPATVEIRFDKDRMRLVTVRFEQAPSYNELVALLKRSLGAPAREQLVATADKQSEVMWNVKRENGTLTVLATEVQGVIRLTCTLRE